MNAVTKLIVHKTALGKFLVMVLKNCSNEIRSNEIRIRRELPVLAKNSFSKIKVLLVDKVNVSENVWEKTKF